MNRGELSGFSRFFPFSPFWQQYLTLIGGHLAPDDFAEDLLDSSFLAAQVVLLAIHRRVKTRSVRKHNYGSYEVTGQAIPKNT